MESTVDWRQHIHADPEILVGKPVVKGTRLAVEFILRLYAAGWMEQQVLASYPTLTPEALRAVFAFAADCARTEALSTAVSQGGIRGLAILGGRELPPAQRGTAAGGRTRCGGRYPRLTGREG